MTKKKKKKKKKIFALPLAIMGPKFLLGPILIILEGKFLILDRKKGFKF